MGFVPCDARVWLVSAVYLIQLWTLPITKDNNIFDESRVTRKNDLCSQLIAAERLDTMGPLKLLRHLEVIFTEKIR